MATTATDQTNQVNPSKRTYLFLKPYFDQHGINDVQYIHNFGDDPDLGPLLILMMAAASNAGGQHTGDKPMTIPAELVTVLKLHEKTADAYAQIFSNPSNRKSLKDFSEDVMQPAMAGYTGGVECPFRMDYFVTLAKKLTK